MRTKLSKIMRDAWFFFKTTGESFSACLKKAWRNYKLLMQINKGIVKFYCQKVNEDLKKCYVTLRQQVYFDPEKQQYRSFKKLILI